jgi:hypothetical protein
MSRTTRGRGKQDHKRPQWGDGGDGTGAKDTPGFRCVHCGAFVPLMTHGTSQRNHCPHCLWSLHVDIKPGDRSALCRSPMEPIAIWASQGEELRLIHRCTGCGTLKPNRIAGDDSESAITELIDRSVSAWRASRREK